MRLDTLAACAAGAFVVTLAFPVVRASAPAPMLTTLSPGGFHDLSHDVNVNIVFLGYEMGGGPQNVDPGTVLAGLPNISRPIHRYPDFYGLRQYLGLTYNYQYNVVFTDGAYENDFFGYLSSIAVPQPRTIYQDAYNAQTGRAVAVGANHWIDAPSVEQWLADNPPTGVDTTDYTIVFVNWYGRADFKNHVYVKVDEPDPDTGYNFGLIRQSRKIIAWGGSSADDPESGLGSLHRIWFHDLSAGPELWTNNWNINAKDVNGNGVLDYRLPPVWEYGNASAAIYRPFDDLSGDLAKVARYVAIDLLFTSSPLYKPAISPPELPSAVQVDIHLYQGEPGFDGTSVLDTAYVKSKLTALQPLNTTTTEVSDQSLRGRALSVYQCFVTYFTGPGPLGQSCFGSKLFGIAFADLFLYHNDKINQFIEGDGDYEVPVFLYDVTDALAPGNVLGFADDNWRDGTQSYVFGFLTPTLRTLGYGFSNTVIHEVGHHVGMSHPHDGYDYEDDVDYFASDAFYFVNAGDESNTVMSYTDLNYDFGQFDRDNMNRFLVGTYINQANSVLAMIYASPRAGQAAAQLTAADAAAAAAVSKVHAKDYPGAAASAKAAYSNVIAAAATAGVKVEPQSVSADYKAKGRSPKFIDTVTYPRSQP
jgi:hypothetical protein